MHTIEVFKTQPLFLTEEIKSTFQRNLIDINQSDERTINLNQLELGIQLGSGGFGSVCECYINKTRYALKRFHRLSKNEKASRESFESEKVALTLRHPNIVRSILTFKWDDVECVLMEYINKKTLQTAIDNPVEVLDHKRRVRLLRQIINGLDYAHSQNIVHLDLKPANILLTTTGECKIADFGCCRVIKNAKESPSTPTKSNLTGTFAYRAPELFKGEAPTTKADIYSVGICLWQMLQRERPYGNEHHQVVIFKVVAYNLRPTVPTNYYKEDEKYVELMQICWNKEKTFRPSTKQILNYI